MKNRTAIIIILLLASVAILATPAPRGKNAGARLAFVDDGSRKSIFDSALARYPDLDITKKYEIRDALDTFWTKYVDANLYGLTDLEIEEALDSIPILLADLDAKKVETDRLKREEEKLGTKIQGLNDRIKFWNGKKEEANGWEAKRDGLLSDKQKLEEDIAGLEIQKSAAIEDRDAASRELAGLKDWEASFDSAIGDEVSRIAYLINNGKQFTLEAFHPSYLDEAKTAFDAYESILKLAAPDSRKELSDGIEYLETMKTCQVCIDESKAYFAGKYVEKDSKALLKRLEKVNLNIFRDSHRLEFKSWLDAVKNEGPRISEYKTLMTSLLEKKCIQFDSDFAESNEMINAFKVSAGPALSYYSALKKSLGELQDLFKKSNFGADELIFPNQYKEKLNSIWSIVSDEQLTIPQP